MSYETLAGLEFDIDPWRFVYSDGVIMVFRHYSVHWKTVNVRDILFGTPAEIDTLLFESLCYVISDCL